MEGKSTQEPHADEDCVGTHCDDGPKEEGEMKTEENIEESMEEEREGTPDPYAGLTMEEIEAKREEEAKLAKAQKVG